MTALLPDRWPAADGLSPDEVAAWLAFNDTGTDDARQAARLLPLLAQAAARQPGRMAVAAPDGGLCYRDLFTVAAEIAARLQAAGVVPCDNVLIPAVRVAAVYPALLGVLLAGAAFVPVRPHDPADRLRFIEQDTGAAVALTVDGAGQWANKIRSTPL